MPSIGLYILNHNNGKYLKSAIYSVLLQCNFLDEFIIIDNASDNNDCYDILRECEYQGIKVIYRDVNSFIDTCEFAINFIKTDFILRLDADDILLPGAIKYYREIINNNDDLSLIVPSYINISSDCLPLNRVKKKTSIGNIPMFPPHGAVTLINRKLLIDNGGYISNFDRQDGFMVWLRFYHLSKKIIVINEELFLYRQHKNNLSSNRRKLLEVRKNILSFFIGEIPNYTLVFYSFPEESHLLNFSKFNSLINQSNRCYYLGSLDPQVHNVNFVKRDFNTYFDSTSLNRYIDKSLDIFENLIIINPTFIGSIDSIFSSLYYAKFTKFKGKIVLVERENRTIYTGLDDLDFVNSINFVLSETNTTTFRKLQGFELITSFEFKESNPVFAVEYYE